jgi:hypothetical protein
MWGSMEKRDQQLNSSAHRAMSTSKLLSLPTLPRVDGLTSIWILEDFDGITPRPTEWALPFRRKYSGTTSLSHAADSPSSAEADLALQSPTPPFPLSA